MAKHKKFERSENYTFYSDLLWCSVPLTGMACYYYGMRPALLMLAGLLTAYLLTARWRPCTVRATSPTSRPVSALPH